MAKLTEKQLFGTWLDIYYAERLLVDHISDTTDNLKDLKSSKRKTTRLLKQASDHYERINGKKPTLPK